MNLYLFNANDSAATYGIGSYLRELTQALENADISIHIVHLHSICPEFEIVSPTSLTNRSLTNQAVLQREQPPQVEHWYVPEVRNQNTFSGSVQKLENYYRNVVFLLRIHIRDTKDLVFHFNYNQSHFLAKELKSAFDCKTVATVHFMRWSLDFLGNLSRLHALKSKPENQRSPYEQLIIATDEYEGCLYSEVNCMIALSTDMKNLLCNEYRIDPNKIAVIPNGLDDICPEKEVDKDGLRRKWHICEKEFVILFAGRLSPVKGLEYLIGALRKVLERVPDCRLLVAGSGHDDVYIQEAKDNSGKTTFTGLLNRYDLSELYQIADVGVIPSLYETFGFVAVEMMMHGLPVVATATSGLN